LRPSVGRAEGAADRAGERDFGSSGREAAVIVAVRA
jgi:hypothetical protein